VKRYGLIQPKKWNNGLPRNLEPRDFELVVDFGCGSRPRNPLKAKKIVGLDVFGDPPFLTSDKLSYMKVSADGKLPFENSSVDALTAFDVLEHIPRQSGYSHTNPFIEIMNEIHRVLRPGGLFLAVTPSFPSSAAFQDPTHVNIISPETHKYFSDDVWGRSLGYGFRGEFVSVSIGWYDWPGSFIDLAVVESQVAPASSGAMESKNRKIKITFPKRIRELLLTSTKEASLLISVLIKRSSFRFLRKPTHYMWVMRKT
jgi:SAM-dependent methyltransferase